MDRDTARAIYSDVKDRVVEAIKSGHGDFTHAVPLDHQASLDPTARAGYVASRIKHQLKIRFGEAGAVRVAKQNSLNFLVIDAVPQGIMLRWKKGDRYSFKTSNHESGQQDDLQACGEANLFGGQPLAHLFVTYTENTDDPLAITLERVAITSERDNEVEWRDVVYTDEAASGPIKIDENFEQTQLPFVGKVKIKTKSAATAEGDEGAKEATGTE